MDVDQGGAESKKKSGKRLRFGVWGGVLLLVVLVLFLVSQDPRRTPLPENLNDLSQIETQLQQLSPDELASLKGFLVRQTISQALGGKPLPPGTTIGEAIETQQAFVQGLQEEGQKNKKP